MVANILGNKMKINYLLSGLLLLLPINAFAYLDPGSGSMLLYFIMGVFASLIYYFKGIVYKVRAFFSGGKADKGLRNLEGIDILFYSEGGQYWHVYQPVIAALDAKGIKSAYYTSSEKDPGLVADYKHLKKAYIGNDLSSFAILNNIKVKLFVTTTPQLDVMQLKRSKNVETYIHLIHAPTDALMYRYYSFDFFDVVMCSGEHQIESIRALEKERGTEIKELLATGLTYFDVLQRNKDELQASLADEKQKTVLVAPTWFDGNLLEVHGAKPLLDIAEQGYQVILRPHPQTFVSKPDLMAKIEAEIDGQAAITIDRAPSGEASMAKADLLLSDLSGIIFDFYFVYEKPVILMSSGIPKAGQEAECVAKEVWEIEHLEKFATLVEVEDLADIKTIIEQAFAKANPAEIAEFRNQSVFNYGQAGLVAANQLIEKLNKAA